MTNHTSSAVDLIDPRHFIVEVDGPTGKAFAICEQVMLVDKAGQGLEAVALERFFRENAMSAAPLPGEQASAWLMSANTAQSAEDDDDDDED